MQDDTFITISVLLAGLVVTIIIIFGLVAHLLAYITNKRKKTASKISATTVAIQPYLLLFSLPVLLVGIIISTVYYSKYFLLYPASHPATSVVPLFNVTTFVTGLAFSLTQILLFYFAFKYRSKPNGKASFVKNFVKLEILWTIIPAIVFLFLFLWGQVLWSKIISEPEGDALEIEVVGQQFSWWVRYPGQDKKFGRSYFGYINDGNVMGIDPSDPNGIDDILPIQIHVVKNKAVKLRLRSKDVIHSFFVPHFRVKMDAVPGMVTKVYFTPTTSTDEMREKLNDPEFNYEVACAELCGRMHFAMKLILVVDEPDQFESWLHKQPSRDEVSKLNSY